LSWLISSTTPMKSANGPSMMRTLWPFVKAIFTRGASAFICFRIARTSLSSSGIGLVPEPTNPVTPGVLRTTYHDWSSSFMSTST
jgi:hypothetical protein